MARSPARSRSCRRIRSTTASRRSSKQQTTNGWAKRSVPTIQDSDVDRDGGHGAKSASAHPTFPKLRHHAYLPWQCLYFLPEPQGQSSLRPILPQLAGFLGSRSAVAVGTSEALANANSSSPVVGSNLWASICGNGGC